MRKSLVVFAGVIVIAIIVLGAVLPNGGKERKLQDPKLKKPTAEVIVEFNEFFAYENYIACPDCGRTDYMFVQMTMNDSRPIAVVVFWHDRIETRKKRVQIFGEDPFDPFIDMRPDRK